MDAELGTVKELWLIVECPHCHRPQVVPKYVGKGQVYDLDKREEQRCGICGKMFGVVLETRKDWTGMTDTDKDQAWRELWELKKYFDRILSSVADEIVNEEPYELRVPAEPDLSTWDVASVHDEFVPMQLRIRELKDEIDRLRARHEQPED